MEAANNVSCDWYPPLSIARTTRLSDRLSIRLSYGASGFKCEWLPTIPSAITKQEVAAYRKARSDIIALIEADIGGSVLLIEQAGLDAIAVDAIN